MLTGLVTSKLLNTLTNRVNERGNLSLLYERNMWELGAAFFMFEIINTSLTEDVADLLLAVTAHHIKVPHTCQNT